MKLYSLIELLRPNNKAPWEETQCQIEINKLHLRIITYHRSYIHMVVSMRHQLTQEQFYQ